MWSFGKRKNNSEMIRRQICSRGIENPRVLQALVRTDRINFVPEEQLGAAYEDRPVPLMPGATVSQPYIVALMTHLLDVHHDHRVLEIGTGSGYQAAVLSHLAAEVWTVEFREPLVNYACERISRSGCRNVHVISGDGWKGYAEAAPYDRILVTAAPGEVPQALVEQLAPGGRMILPIGSGHLQELEIITKSLDGELRRESHSAVQFVPLVHPGQ